ILAMANYPSFDPNNLKKSSSKQRRLSFITDPFEPGSVFKIFTVASALENNMAQKDSSYYCEKGRLKVGNHVIKEASDSKEFEWLSVTDIIKYSSNVGVTKIAFDLTFPRFKKTLQKFNVFDKTGIELPGESRGIFNEAENVTPLTLSNLSFGQGIATTGIQMLGAYAAIANGGHWVKPTILKVPKSKQPTRKKILRPHVVSQLEEMLIKTVEEGTGGKAQMDYYRMAGKTSTAQRVSPTGGYEGYVSGFIGYPVDFDKRVVVFVYVDNPEKHGHYGNIVAGPVFNKIVKYLLLKNRDVLGEKASQLVKANNKQNDYDVVKYTMSSVSKRLDGKLKMPDFNGLDKRSALLLSKKLKEVVVQHKGFGIVKRQYPKVGTSLKGKKKITLYYGVPEYQ
ncbi:MAG: penicillin-binding transpeptidase domain-containing protein, partial [Bacteriovoracia bacterium]